jgi:serine protease Do
MNFYKHIAAWSFAVIISVGGGLIVSDLALNSGVVADSLRLDDQEATIRAINKTIPGVVSINVFENATVEIFDEATETSRFEEQNIKRGAGSGFLISADGLILTNKHVASAGAEGKTEYKIILHSGKQYYAQLIGKDPIADLAILKIYDKNLPFLELGDSNKLTPGMSVIAIGNALGRYDNSATKGIVSGLGRSLLASGNNGEMENLQNVIQTDAQINFGNSGGPLINLEGKVVGINVAKDEGGESLGFAIPINEAKPVITSARTVGKIIRARLGVRYIIITPEMAEERGLPRTSGALLEPGDDGGPAVFEASPASVVGLQAGDIIFEVDGRKIDERLPLQSYISQFSPGKKLGLKIQRGSEIFTKVVTLDELK